MYYVLCGINGRRKSNGKVYETENAKHFFTTTYKNLIIKFIVPKEGYDIDDIYNKDEKSEDPGGFS